jgi:hypothetical protein
MTESAVDQCCHFGAAAFCLADDGAVAGFAAQLEVGEQVFGDFAVGAGEDRRNGVGNDFFRFFNRLIGEICGRTAMNEFSNQLRECAAT